MMSEDIDIKVKAEEVEEDDLQVLTVIQLSKKKPAGAKAKTRSTPEDSAKRTIARHQFLAKLSEEERKRRRDQDNAQRRLRRQQKREAGKTEAEIEQDRLRRERRNKAEIRWKRMSDDELGEEVKRILIEKRDKWKHKVKWQEGPTGKLLMTRKELESVKRTYQNFLHNQRRKEKMTEEELAQRREAHKVQQQLKSARLTEEEIKLRRVKHFINKRACWASKSEEEKKVFREKWRASSRNWQLNATEEQKARHAENVKKAVRRWNTKNRERLAEQYRQKRLNETPEETRQRLEKNRERLAEHYRQKHLNETPEERRQRLLYYRINQAKRKLKRKLAQEGLPQEVIQQRVEELERKMRTEPLPPLEQISSYKPKPRKNPPNRQTKPEGPVSDPPMMIMSREAPETIQAQAPLSTMSQAECDIQSNRSRQNNSAVHRETVEAFASAPSSQLPPHSVPEESPPSPEDMANDDNSDEPMEENENQASMDIGMTVEQPEEDMEQTTPVVTATPTGILPGPQQNPPTPKPNPDHHKCPHCTAATFTQRAELHSHICSTHPAKCWRCPKCSAVAHSPQELMAHFKTQHPKSSAAKDEEDRDGRRPGRRSPVSPSPFACMKCPVSRNFDTHPKLTLHVRATHPNSFWPCPLCKLLKYNEASLALHSKICRRKLFKRRTTAAKQQQRKPKKPEGPVCFCKLCGKGFTSRSGLGQHTNDVHLQRRNHECDLCGKRFKRATTLNGHRQQIHFGIRRQQKRGSIK